MSSNLSTNASHLHVIHIWHNGIYTCSLHETQCMGVVQDRIKGTTGQEKKLSVVTRHNLTHGRHSDTFMHFINA